MNKRQLIEALTRELPQKLADDIVAQFFQIRQDVATRTLGRSAPGKFVETFVQVLQWLENKKFEDRPDVDTYLRALESRGSSLGDGLRICAARIARSMYTLRSKRNIAHKNEVDPNEQDLGILHSMAQWVMAELIRTVGGLSMEQAGKLVAQVTTPIGGMVEDFGNHKLVLKDLSTPDEALVLRHSIYPNSVHVRDIIASLDRHSENAVRVALTRLWKRKLVQRETAEQYKLTQRGFQHAISIIIRQVE